MEKTTLGQALVERRIELGVDKGKAAAMVGVTRTTYVAYESDSRRLSIDGLPALRTFLNVSIEDFLELYAATCVAQARVILMRDLFVGDVSITERPAPTTMLVKTVRDDELSVVERVFFDVVTAEGHGVASPYVTQPSASAPVPRAPTSSVLGRFDQDGVNPNGESTKVAGDLKKDKKSKKKRKAEKRDRSSPKSKKKEGRKRKTKSREKEKARKRKKRKK